MRICTITLGCKVNQYESEAIMDLFSKNGYEVVDNPEKADVIVVNSCAVTSVSAGKSRQAVRRAKKNNPNALVILTGCYSQTDYEKACSILEADIVTGTDDKEKLLEYIKSHFEKNQRILVHNEKIDAVIDDLPTPVSGSRTRAVLKIQDGCNNYCSYCIIPYARGPIRSRDFENVLMRLEEISQAGYKETVLTGIHLASYGRGTDNDLVDLLEKVGEEFPLMKIRLGSMDPSYLDEEKIIRLSRINSLCKHFHLSLQSGCDETLKRMNRKYSTNHYALIAGLLKKYNPDVSLTTDVIVGFPGESDEEFMKTVEFIKSVGFYRLHVFPYSPRQGTKAAKMKDMIPKSVKEERSKVLTDLNNLLMESYHKMFIGRKMNVLFETDFHGKNGYYEGLTDNYIRIVSNNPDIKTGEFLDVLLKQSEKDYVIAY